MAPLPHFSDEKSSPPQTHTTKFIWSAWKAVALIVAFGLAYFSFCTDIAYLWQDDKRLLQFNPKHVELVPTRLIDSLKSEDFISSNPSLRGISDAALVVLAGRGSRTFGPGYIDVTDIGPIPEHPVDFIKVPQYTKPDPSAHPEIEQLIARVDANELKGIVGNLSTSFSTRYYKSKIARKASTWVQTYMEKIIGAENVKLYENSFDQPNVVGRIPGNGSSDKIIILGGHLDSTSAFPWMKAPGADDDASGVAVVLATLRILTEAGWKGQYDIEGHAYAGEEGGLLGSQRLASIYSNSGRTLRGMLNLEMVGWQPDTSTNKGKSSTITVLSDPIPAMSSHMSSIVEAYVPTAEARSARCGYGCSDHISWYNFGYPVVCLASYAPTDAHLNPNYHSFADTWDKLNYERMSDFVRATLAWIVEISSD